MLGTIWHDFASMHGDQHKDPTDDQWGPYLDETHLDILVASYLYYVTIVSQQTKCQVRFGQSNL